MIYFVTEQYIKTYTPITQNVDVNDFLPLIKSAADGYVRSYLGTYFYNDLLTKYNAQTLNPDEITLVQDYIKDAVAWRACSESVLTLSYQLKNKGIQSQSGDFSANPGFQPVSFISHHYRDKADFYDGRLKKYLLDNRDLYPEFISDLNKDTILKPFPCWRRDNYFQSGINFV
jgi:hypothetical protein